jgi:adenine-specific DNA-methyltransferase
VIDSIAKEVLSDIDASLGEQFLSAIIRYFQTENDKLGLGLEQTQIANICTTLLFGAETTDEFRADSVSEKSLLDEYHKEELAIMDYLHLSSLEVRKQLGQYATPKEIARYIVKSVGYIPSRDILNKTLIDPACGSGAFLVEGTRIYLAALKKCRVSLHDWYPMVLSAITGVDIDPKACFFARLNLSTLLAPAILEFAARNGGETLRPLSVHCDDTLALVASEGGTLFYNRRTLPLKGRFDFVVGNPPYFKIKDLSESLKVAFAESIYGHPNAYGLFIHAGIGMMKPNGRLGFIVPRSMLSGLYFKNLRHLIEKETSIREIVYLSERKKVFENVLHGTMILSLERNRAQSGDIAVCFVQSAKEMRSPSGATIPAQNVIQRLNGLTVWFVADSPEVYSVINRIIKDHPLLSGQKIDCVAKTGQIVWNRIKPLLRARIEPDTLPLVWATDVGKFTFAFNRMGSARPPFLKVTPKTEGLIVRGGSILIQRVTADEQPSRIVACIPEKLIDGRADRYFVENHLNIIQPTQQNPHIDLFFLLGVLNSDIVDFFFRAMNGNTQVSATELNLLPIPLGKYERDIADLAKTIQKTEHGKKQAGLVEKLNQLVAMAYGLGGGDLEFLREFLLKRFKTPLRSDKV